MLSGINIYRTWKMKLTYIVFVTAALFDIGSSIPFDIDAKLAPAIHYVLNPDSPRGDLRIIGGDNATKGELYWQVSLQYLLKNTETKVEVLAHFCGASILNEYWILTAAHCMGTPEGIPKEIEVSMVVMAGEYNTKENDGTEEAIPVKTKFIHSGYDKEKSIPKDDITLLKLEKKLTYTKNINDMNLPYARENSVGLTCTISGWGATSFNMETFKSEDYPEVLKENEIPIIDDAMCQKSCEEAFKKEGKEPSEVGWDCTIAESTMCGGVKDGGEDTCQGDSGGPLVCQRPDGEQYQAGVVSYGLGCGLPGLYGVYTEVSHYTDWIDYVMKEESLPDNGANTSVVITHILIVACYFLSKILQ